MINKLDWDSEFFGCNIASLSLVDGSSFKEVEKFIQDKDIDFIQSLCRIEDINRIRTLENNNFHFADLKVTYSLNVEEYDDCEKAVIDLATAEDKDLICNLASNAFNDSRYYGYEQLFAKDKVDEMFTLWAEKSINGQFDDFCLKVKEGDSILGFITAKIHDNKKAVIGLVAVDESYRSKGVGTSLLKSLIRYLKSLNIFEIDVSTQGKNTIAQNFYIKQGFKIKSLESWYYCHIRRNEKENY